VDQTITRLTTGYEARGLVAAARSFGTSATPVNSVTFQITAGLAPRHPPFDHGSSPGPEIQSNSSFRPDKRRFSVRLPADIDKNLH
jgi:hypothetical protein